MKTVKIKFVGYWKDFDPNTQFIYRILCKHYNVIICDDPDYIICSCFGEPYEYCKYPQVRIMVVGENYIPDFNLVDYAICPYPISFLDRCFFKPGCLDSFGHAISLEGKKREYDSEFLKSKQYFASFIASHESEHNIRGDFFKELCKYKRVESPGSYLNNMSDGLTVNWTNSSKTDFQLKCKFSLCFESTKHAGFVTEKITDAFFADTIPVYFGSDTVKDIFNPKAFINVSDFASFEDAVQFIKKVDENDELYLKIVSQPILNEEKYFSTLTDELEQFVLHIFEQPIVDAYRRSEVYFPKAHENYLLDVKRNAVTNISTAGLMRHVLRRIKNRIC